MCSNDYSNNNHPLKPFELETVFGFNSNVEVLNLTKKSTEIIVAACAGHVLSIYHESSGRVQHLMGGHTTSILNLDCDASGRFLVSAAIDSCVVWDRKNCNDDTPVALRHIEYPFEKGGSIHHVCLSANAKYLIVIIGGANDKTAMELQFWSWSAGLEVPDFSYPLPINKWGKVRAVIFNPFSDGTEFAVTMARNVLFGRWSLLQRTIDIVTPKVDGKYKFHQTRFTPFTTAISWTGHRYGTIWSPDNPTQVYALQKVVKITESTILHIDWVDGMFVVVKESSRIMFFDDKLKLLITTNPEVHFRSFMFNLGERVYRMVDVNTNNTMDDDLLFEEDENKVEVFFRQNLSVCATNDARPFMVRQLVALTKTSNVVYCDLINKTATELSIVESPSVINTFDVDVGNSFIFAGCLDGRLFKYDYKHRKMIGSTYIRNNNGDIRKPISNVMFSKCFNYVLATMGSRIQFVDEKFLTEVGHPVKPTNGTIDMMCATDCKQYIACSDSECKTMLFTNAIHSSGVYYLSFIGKHQAHNKVITSLLFLGMRLFSFSRDQFFVEYDVMASVKCKELLVLRRERFDQFSQPLCAIHLGMDLSGVAVDSSLLVCDSEFKCKFLHGNSMNVLKTVTGPVLDGNPIRLMSLIDPDQGDPGRYMAFATEGSVLGLQLLPFTGNSFQHIGILAHPTGILKLFPMPNSKCLFTLGRDSHSISMWSIRTDAVNQNYERGGVGLLPFCKALPGGKDGWLFREMQALFYYMQIITSSMDSPEEKHVGNTIVMAEAPDYLRSLGFFPSEVEVHNILSELSDQHPQMAKHMRVSFGELLKVYVNHKPVRGYPTEDILQAMALVSSNPTATKDMEMDINDLMENCCSQGEPMGRVEFARCLRLLLDPDTDQLPPERAHKSGLEDDIVSELMRNLPEMFNVRDFLKLLFGLELSSGNNEMVYANVLDPGTVNVLLKNDVLNVGAFSDRED